MLFVNLKWTNKLGCLRSFVGLVVAWFVFPLFKCDLSKCGI